MFQFQGGFARIPAEKFRIFNAVALGVGFGILYRLLHYLHADHLAGGLGHTQGDGSNTAVQVQNQVLCGDFCLGNSGFIEPLCLVVIDLVERPGGQTEVQSAQRILNIAGAIKDDFLVAQHRIGILGVHGQHQGGKAIYRLQFLNQVLAVGQLSAVQHQTHQNLSGNCATTDINMPQKAFPCGFIVGGNPKAVYIIYHNLPNLLCFVRENQATVIFHHCVGACLKESRIDPAFFAGNGVLRLVPVAGANGGGKNGHICQAFAADAV